MHTFVTSVRKMGGWTIGQITPRVLWSPNWGHEKLLHSPCFTKVPQAGRQLVT